MNSLKWLVNKNTRHGRGIRTALQAFLGVLTFVVGLISVPGLADVLTANNVVTVSSLAAWVGVISYLQNFLEDMLREW